MEIVHQTKIVHEILIEVLENVVHIFEIKQIALLGQKIPAIDHAVVPIIGVNAIMEKVVA